jgi:hypothetical protein
MELSVQDISNAVQIIDECSRRGAIQGPELQSVGKVRDKLAAFVEANAPKEEAAVAPPPPEITGEETVVDFPEEISDKTEE